MGDALSQPINIIHIALTEHIPKQHFSASPAPGNQHLDVLVVAGSLFTVGV